MAAPVWTKLGSAAPSGSGSTVAVTLTRDQDAGTILVVDGSVNGTGTGTASCTDSRGGNTYQSDYSTTGTRPAGGCSCKPANLLKTGDVVTLNPIGASGNGRAAVVYQVSNLDQTTWFKATANAQANSTAPDSGSTSLTAGDYELHGVASYNTGGTSYTAGSNGQSGTYTLLDDFAAGTTTRLATEHMEVNPGSTLSYKAAGTLGSGVQWTQVVVVYFVSASAKDLGTGTFTAASSFAATRNVSRSLSGSFSAASTFSATPNVSRSLTGSFAASSTFAATANVSRSLAGSFAAVSSFAGTLTHQVSLAGSFSASCVFAVTSNVERSLTGSFSAVCVFAGTPGVTPGVVSTRLRTVIGVGL